MQSNRTIASVNGTWSTQKIFQYNLWTSNHRLTQQIFNYIATLLKLKSYSTFYGSAHIEFHVLMKTYMTHIYIIKIILNAHKSINEWIKS